MRLRDVAPAEVLRDTPRIVMTGREEVLVEQHGGLFSYESRCIRLRTRMGLLTVTGEGLYIDHFGPEDLLIRGKVHTVALEGEDA